MSHRPSRPTASRRRRQGGFTLIELLVVLVILGLIAAFAAPQVIKYLSTAKQKSASIQIDRLAGQLDLYRLEVGSYPDDSDGLQALLEKPADASGWNGPYLDKESQLVDPWGNRYRYRFPGEHGAYDLFSYGADNQPGGEGEAADVTNW